MPEPIQLHHADFKLLVDPALGGSAVGLWYKGQPVLRDSRGASQPTDGAGFPLIPFAGRIHHGRFKWNGKEVQLAKNFPPEPHAIHGQAWQNQWRVDQCSASRLKLVFEYDGGDWPFAYRAEQLFEVTGNGMQLVLSVTNNAAQNMPAGLGWHPYFPIEGLVLDTSTGQTEFSGAVPVGLDNVYDWLAPKAHIELPAGRFVLQADELFTDLVIYSPEGQGFVCIEPLSHTPDVINAPGQGRGAMVSLAPAQTLHGAVSLTLAA